MKVKKKKRKKLGQRLNLLKKKNQKKKNRRKKNPKKKEVEVKFRKANFGKGPRLYVKGVFTGFRRNKVWTLNNQAILKLEGLNSKKEAQYYLGKRVVFIYKAKEGYKTIWGRIRSAHGNNGAVLAKFLHNLPPRGIGAPVRVMLYPQRK